MAAKRVLVAGAGVSGSGAVRLLAGRAAEITVADDRLEAARELAGRPGVRACDTEEAARRLEEVDLVVTSPGWRPDAPLLRAAERAGIEVIGDVELAFRLDKAGSFGPPRTWLGVTGTNGKTTTTGMLSAIVKAAGLRGEAVGNIGISTADALLAEARVDVLVCELSSFQLHWAPTFAPDAGVLLNLAEDHLDWHGGFADYRASKARIWRGPVAVAGIDDAAVRALAKGRQVLGFTLREPGPGEVGVIGGRILSRLGEEPLDVASAQGLEPAGPVGVLDALAAATVALSQGIAPEAIAAGLASYRVSGHRGQVVAEGRGRRWIDNSKATNPHAAQTALAGLEDVVWVAGGQLKGAEVDPLVAAIAPRLRGAVLLGADREALRAALGRLAPAVPVRVVDNLEPEEAMCRACAAAFELSADGSTIVLAPAAASLDMYRGMGQRGDLFAAAARVLSEDGGN